MSRVAPALFRMAGLSRIAGLFRRARRSGCPEQGPGGFSRRAFLRAAGLLALLAAGNAGCSARSRGALAATTPRPRSRPITPSPVPTVTLPDLVLPAGAVALAPAAGGAPAAGTALPGAAAVSGTRAAAGNTGLIVIGDSIATAPRGWPVLLAERWRGGRVTLRNYAVQGARITGSLTADPLGGMEGQVAAAAREGADTIIVALGTNDPGVTPTDLEILGSDLTSYLSRLRRDHPSAAIYVMGILPGVLADEAGRAAKQPILRAAARVRRLPFWETDGWINGTAHGEGADTIDGLHPDAAGHEKIVAHVLALLPR